MHPEPTTEPETNRYESTSSGSTGAILGRIAVSLAAVGVLELLTYMFLQLGLRDVDSIDGLASGMNVFYLVAGFFGAAAGAAVSFQLFPPESPTHLE